MPILRNAVMAIGLGISVWALAPAANAQEIAVPLATWGGASHVCVREFVPSMERALKDLQPNRIKFQHFPGGQLGQDKDMPVAVPTGQVKFAWITVNGWTGTVRDTRVMDAPTGLTMKQLDELVDRQGGILAILQKKFSEKNSVLLGLADLGPPAVVSKVPIKSPADLKGKKVRVFSEGQAEAIKAFGGSPVTIAFAEVYTAMQHGTVDAAIIGFQGVDSQRMHEVAKHVLMPASFLGTTMMGWTANKQWLESIPEPDRKVFVNAVDRASRENRAAILAEIDQLTKTYQDRGMGVMFLSPEMPEYPQWKAATDPLLKNNLRQLSPELAALIQPAG
jgi:TRAP-type C4-dicarboxylate transport system substrate-binding protein